MIYTTVAFAALIGAADAFQAGMMSAPRSAVRSSAATMQVAEAEVASPVALAKVRAPSAAATSRRRGCRLFTAQHWVVA